MLSGDGIKLHLGSDEGGELVGRGFAQSLEAGDLRSLAERRKGLVFLGFGVAVHGLLLVAHAKEGRLQHVEMAMAHEVGKELEKEGEQQHANVHAIDVGIRGDDHLVVAKSVQAVLDVEGVLQAVELVVLVDDLLAEAEGVERLSLEAEDGLGVDVACLGDRATSGIALHDEKGGFVCTLVLGVEVDAAVAQFLVVQVDLLGLLASQFSNAGELLAFLFAGYDLRLYCLGGIWIAVKVVVELLLDEVVDVVAY